jgi:phenylacetate-CoA ligase
MSPLNSKESGEKIYLALSIAAQNVVCSLEGWRLRRSRFNGAYFREMQKIAERATWSQEQIDAERDERLRRFIAHIASHVPYYRRKFKEWGADPKQIRTLIDLQKLPTLTRAEVQDNPEFLAEGFEKRALNRLQTSGTTGAGLTVWMDAEAMGQQVAVWSEYLSWYGIKEDSWTSYFGGRSVVPLTQTEPPFWRTNLPGRQVLFSGYHISENNLPAYVKKLDELKSPRIHAYPSMLTLVAAFMVENKIRLSYKPQCISTSSETLLAGQEELIERAFGVRPVLHYGMTEGVANISECEQRRFHVHECGSAVEFVPTETKGQYRVIGTNFCNLAFPLLRYETGDIASDLAESCKCGRLGRTVGFIDGRQEDYVFLKSGARVGRLDHIFKAMEHVREAQIVQLASGLVMFRVVKGPRYANDDEQRLRSEIVKRLGSDTDFKIEYVQALERSKTGKLRFVISEIEQGKLQAKTEALTPRS